MQINENLDTYWITFPQDPSMPVGIGVTARSPADAFELMRERGVAAWFEGAREIRIQRGVRIDDLDPTNIRPHIGPMPLRGVWYPAMNVGLGGPEETEFRPLA